MHEILTDGLPPLNPDQRLNLAVKRLVGNMDENGYIEYLASDERTFGERIAETGYNAEVSGESINHVYFSAEPTPEKVMAGVTHIFNKMFEEELEPGNARKILNPNFSEAGVEFFQSVNSVTPGWLLLAAIDFGSSLDPEKPALTGVVFSDMNSDGFYNPGEGVHDAEIIIEDDSTSHGIFTGQSGGLTMWLDQGVYQVAVNIDGEDGFVETVEITEENESFIFTVE